MTNRRLTEQEKEYQEERRKIISLCSPEYVADAPFPFASLQTTHRRGFTGSDLGERWPSRLVATAAEDRLSFRRNPHNVFLRQPAIAETIGSHTHKSPRLFRASRTLSRHRAHRGKYA